MNRWSLRAPALLAAAALTLSAAGCTGQVSSAPASDSGASAPSVSAPSEQQTFRGQYDEDDFAADIPQELHTITLSDDLTVVEGGSVSVSDGIVRIGAAGNYLVTGTLTDGQLLIDAGEQDTVRLILQDVSITNPDGAALFADTCGKLILTLAPDSVNTLADSSAYLFAEGEDEPDAALFSKADLTINGTGALTVSANYRNGIASKDNLVITDGQIAVTAVNDALRGKDSISICGGSLDLTAGNDGIKSNQDNDPEKGWICIDGGTFRIEAGCDAIQAETDLTISDGDFTVLTGGGSVITDMSAAPAGGFGPPRAGAGQTLPEPPAAHGTPEAAHDPSRPETETDDRQPPAAPPEPSAGAAGLPDDAASEETGSDSFKGLKAGNALTLYSGNFSLDCLDDALHSNGDLTVEAGSFTIATDDDALHADAALTVNGGTIVISRCYEGLEGAAVTLNGGEIRLTARDDGVNSAGGSDGEPEMDRFSQGGNDSHIVINGGLLQVTASGDGLDANGSITLNGGTVLINGPTAGADTAIDFNTFCEINGGILAAAGSAGMAQDLSDTSSQPSLTVWFDAAQPAGTAVNLTDGEGNLILSFAPSREFGMIQLSSPDLSLGESYTLSLNTDGNQSANGLAEAAEPGEALFTVSLESAVTSVGSDGQPFEAGRSGGHGPGRTRDPELSDRGGPQHPGDRSGGTDGPATPVEEGAIG